MKPNIVTNLELLQSLIREGQEVSHLDLRAELDSRKYGSDLENLLRKDPSSLPPSLGDYILPYGGRRKQDRSKGDLKSSLEGCSGPSGGAHFSLPDQGNEVLHTVHKVDQALWCAHLINAEFNDGSLDLDKLRKEWAERVKSISQDFDDRPHVLPYPLAGMELPCDCRGASWQIVNMGWSANCGPLVREGSSVIVGFQNGKLVHVGYKSLGDDEDGFKAEVYRDCRREILSL